jgi:FtsH-binding integral membrane protein
MSYPEKTRSNAWFLLPIFFGMIGGIIAFFILRRDNPRKARNCLYVGIIFMIIGIILNILIASTVPGLDSGFNVNV